MLCPRMQQYQTHVYGISWLCEGPTSERPMDSQNLPRKLSGPFSLVFKHISFLEKVENVKAVCSFVINVLLLDKDFNRNNKTLGD